MSSATEVLHFVPKLAKLSPYIVHSMEHNAAARASMTQTALISHHHIVYCVYYSFSMFYMNILSNKICSEAPNIVYKYKVPNMTISW